MSISSVSIPKFLSDALAHPGWHHTMLDEMNVLQNNGTWKLVPLPSRKSVGPDDTIDRLKARHEAKGYTKFLV